MTYSSGFSCSLALELLYALVGDPCSLNSLVPGDALGALAISQHLASQAVDGLVHVLINPGEGSSDKHLVFLSRVKVVSGALVTMIAALSPSFPTATAG